MKQSKNEGLIEHHLGFEPFSILPGLLVCDGGEFRAMHTTKIIFAADTSRLGPK